MHQNFKSPPVKHSSTNYDFRFSFIRRFTHRTHNTNGHRNLTLRVHTVRTRPRVESRPSDCERIDGAQDRWLAPSDRAGPLPPLRLSAPNWWVVHMWKISKGLCVDLPHTASFGRMLGVSRAGGSWECQITCVPARAQSPGVAGNQDSGARECKLYPFQSCETAESLAGG